jgi:ribonuclease HI
MSFFYAVRVGRRTGIFSTWDEAAREVLGFSGAQYKKFASEAEAMDFMQQQQPTYIVPKVKLKRIKTRFRKIRYEEVDPDLPRIYCDGSCINNGTSFAKAGFGVFVSRGSPYNLSRPVPSDQRQTNQVAELLAAINAVESVNWYTQTRTRWGYIPIASMWFNVSMNGDNHGLPLVGRGSW